MKALAFIFLFLFLGIFFLFFLSTQENYKNIPETSNTFSLTGLIIGEDETIEQFDKDIDLIIKEPNSIMKSSSNEYMDFQVDGGLRLSFDLLNQSEYVSGIEKKVREEKTKKIKEEKEKEKERESEDASNEASDVSVSNGTESSKSPLSEKASDNKTDDMASEDEDMPTLNDKEEIEDTEIEKENEADETNDGDVDSGDESAPTDDEELTDIGNSRSKDNDENESSVSNKIDNEASEQEEAVEVSDENAGITGNIIRFFGFVGRVIGIDNNEAELIQEEEVNVSDSEIRGSLDGLNDSELTIIEDDAAVSIRDNEFTIEVNETAAAENKVDYKWGYRVVLKDDYFIAKIDVTSNNSIIVIDDSSLQIGNGVLSFKDLKDLGYSVRFDKPQLIEVRDLDTLNNETESVEEEINETLGKIINETIDEERRVTNETVETPTEIEKKNETEKEKDLEKEKEEAGKEEKNETVKEEKKEENENKKEEKNEKGEKNIEKKDEKKNETSNETENGTKDLEDELSENNREELEDTDNTEYEKLQEESKQEKQEDKIKEEKEEDEKEDTEDVSVSDKTENEASEQEEAVEVSDENAGITGNIIRFFGFVGRAIVGLAIEEEALESRYYENKVTVYIERDFSDYFDEKGKEKSDDVSVTDKTDNGAVDLKENQVSNETDGNTATEELEDTNTSQNKKEIEEKNKDKSFSTITGVNENEKENGSNVTRKISDSSQRINYSNDNIYINSPEEKNNKGFDTTLMVRSSRDNTKDNYNKYINSSGKNKKKDATVVASRVTSFCQEYNNCSNINYINFSNSTNNVEDAAVGSRVIHSSHKGDLLSRRVQGSIPGRSASTLSSDNNEKDAPEGASTVRHLSDKPESLPQDNNSNESNNLNFSDDNTSDEILVTNKTNDGTSDLEEVPSALEGDPTSIDDEEFSDTENSHRENKNKKQELILGKDFIDVDESGFLSLGDMLILDPSFNITNFSSTLSTDVNVTQEGNFSHLTIDDSISPWNSLVLYMPFDHNFSNPSAHNKTYDYSSANNDGTLVNATLPSGHNISGFIGGALQLNNLTADVVEVVDAGDSPSLSFDRNQTFTIMFWANKDLTSGANIISKRDMTSIGYDIEYEFTGGIHRIRVNLRDSDSRIDVQTNSSYSANIVNKWTHVAVVFNGSTNYSADDIFIYVNGTEHGKSINQNKLDGSFDNDAPFEIGGTSALNSSYIGELDEVMVFNVSLNSSEILKIYQNQSQRFKNPGTMMFNTTTTEGYGKVTVETANWQAEHYSNLSVFITYYDGTWKTTAAQNISSA